MTTVTTTISSGITSTGITVTANNTFIVAAGGTASSFTVVADTLATNGMSNQAGGTVVSAVISSGGNLYEIGGVDRFTTILSGGFELVSNGGVTSNTVMSGGTFRVAQGGTAVSASLLFNALAIVKGSGGSSGLMSNTTISNGAELIVSSGGVASGSIVLSGGLEVVAPAGSAFGANVASGATEVVSSGGTVTNTTLQNGGSLALRGLTFNAGGSASFDLGTGVLTVVEGTNTFTETLAGSYAGLYFHTAAGLSNSTLVTVDTNPACFAAGTRLLTENGEVPVEQIRIGDRMAVSGGGFRPVTWVGHRRVACLDHTDPATVCPIRIAAEAFAPGQPSRPLLLSPDHAVSAEGVLIPVSALVNGTSIRRMQPEHVEYWHVELETHDVILAENLPVESYLENDNRIDFDSEQNQSRLGGEFELSQPCAPRMQQGEIVETVRAVLTRRSAALAISL